DGGRRAGAPQSRIPRAVRAARAAQMGRSDQGERRVDGLRFRRRNQVAVSCELDKRIAIRCLISALSGADEGFFIAGGPGAMKTVSLGVAVAIVSTAIASTAIVSTLAHAEDMAEMISRYRREHGLSVVKTDPQLTAIAERQAKAMAASGVMDHDVAGPFSS